MALTPAGMAFQSYFTRMMNELDDMVEKAREMNSDKFGKLNIGVFQEWDFSKEFRLIIQKFRNTHGNIALNIDTNLEKNLFRGLKSGQHDVIIGMKVQIQEAISEGFLTDIEVFDLLNARKILLFSKYNPITSRASLKPSDFKDQTLYTYADESGSLGLGSNVALLSRKYGFKPKYKVVSSIDTIFTAISTGEGYAIVDSMVRARNNTDFCYIELDDFNTISLARLKTNKSRQSTLFISDCLSYFNNINNEKEEV